MRIAFFGGIYNNWLALEAALRDARLRGAERLYCLGDLGAFGPHPERVFPLLFDHAVQCVRGNYDDSIGRGLSDCQCGYTDPRDNWFAQVSYDYTLAHTSDASRAWLRTLPPEIRFEIEGVRFLLCHGSPRRTNEFLWESNTSTAFLNRLADEHAADVLLGTHSGIHWCRELSLGRQFINVGVLGRPENDGRTCVWYALLDVDRLSVAVRTDAARAGANADGAGGAAEQGSRLARVTVEFVPLAYDHERLAREMRDEKLPEEFIATVMTGWWTTCLEILPSRERRRGRW